jgi:hypothetical protein
MNPSAPPKPNFLIIGAAKAGTTSLYGYLSSHPQVFMPTTVKEPLYFVLGEEEQTFQYRDWRSVTMDCSVEWEAYLKLFAGAGEAKAIGEATPYYLPHPTAAEKIQRRLGQPKIIALLRDPIARGYSHYTYNRMRKVEKAASFAEAVQAERALDNPWYAIRYLGSGRYADYLAPYYERFGADNMLVLLFEDLVRNRKGTLRQVYEFLEIDTKHEAPDEVRNVTLKENAITSALFHLKGSDSALGQFARKTHKALTKSDAYLIAKEKFFSAARSLAGSTGAGKPDKLDKQTRAELLPLVSEDVARLEDLIGRDLSAWRR